MLTAHIPRITHSAVFIAAIGCASTPTREAEDRRDPLRRCESVPSAATDPIQAAVSCAEWFVRTQGYTAAPAHADTARIVSEGIEYEPSKAAWLRRRHNTLAASAVGSCSHPGNAQVLVVFADVPPDSGLRAVTLFLDGRGLRVQHSDLLRDVFESSEYGCTRRTTVRSDGAT